MNAHRNIFGTPACLTVIALVVLAAGPLAIAQESPSYRWSNSATQYLGSDDQHDLEVSGELEDNDLVLTGIGFRVGSDDVTTMRLQFSQIQPDGTLGKKETRNFGSDKTHELETFVEVGTQEVITGLGVRCGNDHLTTLKVYARPLDENTGKLGPVKVYYDGYPNEKLAQHELEVDWQPEINQETTILTGVGIRVGGDDVTTLQLKTGRLAPEFGISRFRISGSQQIRTGSSPNHELEAFYADEEDDLVLVGMGFRVGNDDLSTMELLLSPLLPDGSISDDVIRVSRGRAPEHELETRFQCPQGRVIVGCGMRVGEDNLTTLVVHTRRLDPQTGRLIDPRTYREGSLPEHELEAEYAPLEDLEHTILRGIGGRVGSDNFTTLRLVYGKIERRSEL